MLKIVGQIMKMVIRNYAFIVYAHIKVEHSKNCRFRFYYGNTWRHAVIPLKEEGDEVIMPPEHFSSCFIANIILEGKSTKDIENIIGEIESFIKVEIQ